MIARLIWEARFWWGERWTLARMFMNLMGLILAIAIMLFAIDQLVNGG